jgi:Family of unknown function (DUF5681)
MSKRYTVGRGKPPVHSRFRKGESGNPQGRPKKPKGPPKKVMDVKQALIEALDLPVAITEGGKKKEITRLEALARSCVMRAIQGDRTLAKLVLSLANGLTIEDFAKEKLFKFTDPNGQTTYSTQDNMDALEDFVTMVHADIAAEAAAAEADVSERKTAKGSATEVNDENGHEAPTEGTHAPNDETYPSSDDEDLTLETGSILDDEEQSSEPNTNSDDDDSESGPQ